MEEKQRRAGSSQALSGKLLPATEPTRLIQMHHLVPGHIHTDKRLPPELSPAGGLPTTKRCHHSTAADFVSKLRGTPWSPQ